MSIMHEGDVTAINATDMSDEERTELFLKGIEEAIAKIRANKTPVRVGIFSVGSYSVELMDLSTLPSKDRELIAKGLEGQMSYDTVTSGKFGDTVRSLAAVTYSLRDMAIEAHNRVCHEEGCQIAERENALVLPMAAIFEALGDIAEDDIPTKFLAQLCVVLENITAKFRSRLSSSDLDLGNKLAAMTPDQIETIIEESEMPPEIAARLREAAKNGKLAMFKLTDEESGQLIEQFAGKLEGMGKTEEAAGLRAALAEAQAKVAGEKDAIALASPNSTVVQGDFGKKKH